MTRNLLISRYEHHSRFLLFAARIVGMTKFMKGRTQSGSCLCKSVYFSSISFRDLQL